MSVEEGKELAREFQCPFFETSAAFRYYIDEVFAALVRQIRQREAEVVRSGERKTRRSRSLWSRLKAPFRKKQHSEHWVADGILAPFTKKKEKQEAVSINLLPPPSPDMSGQLLT